MPTVQSRMEGIPASETHADERPKEPAVWRNWIRGIRQRHIVFVLLTLGILSIFIIPYFAFYFSGTGCSNCATSTADATTTIMNRMTDLGVVPATAIDPVLPPVSSVLVKARAHAGTTSLGPDRSACQVGGPCTLSL